MVLKTSLGAETIRRGDIARILEDESIYEWLQFYNRYQTFGAPLDAGWMDWPFHWVEALEAIEAELEAIRKEQESDGNRRTGRQNSHR